MDIHGIACMRRRSDGWLNATQILKIAGVDKGKRTKVLEKEILTGEHEKVQGGYGKYQGTWISYKRGREFCRQYGVEDILAPLLEYDITADGSSGQGQDETPTKEQAMAANRKRFYASASDGAKQNSGPVTNGTFFSNISSTTSVALAAMNKAARLNSPGSRPGSIRRPSQQDGAPVGSQQSAVSDGSLNDKYDSGYGTQANGEPPRKRLRPGSQDGTGQSSLGAGAGASMRSASPTEPNESFVYDNAMSYEYTNTNGDAAAAAPLPTPSTDEQHDKMNLILDLFAEAGRTDYGTHPALSQLSGEDLNIPLDASANNALHWAATLAKVSLLKLLIKKGANIYRGNAAGQSPLISAVLVNNCWEHSCFPELLDLLGPLIELRDVQGRTILHHIAVSSGIKGRAPSSKYYLEALLEFLVRTSTTTSGAAASSTTSLAAVAAANIQARQNGDPSSQKSTNNAPAAPLIQSSRGAVTLVRLISHVVNARDKAGNTALNLVARIGNRSIIQQLMEIHADPALPNHKGISAKDFGVGVETSQLRRIDGSLASPENSMPAPYPLTQDTQADGEVFVSGLGAGSQAEDIGQDVISCMSPIFPPCRATTKIADTLLAMTTMLTQSLTSHRDTLRHRTEQIDQLNSQIQVFSARQKQELDHLAEIKERVRLRTERQAKIANLKRSIAEKRRESAQRSRTAPPPSLADVEPTWLNDTNSQTLLDASADSAQLSSLPSPTVLKATLNAYLANNSNLQRQADELRARSSEMEGMYRKVVSLCTGVAEDKVEESLPALVAAVESEKGALGREDVGRVRDFLRRVDGGNGAVNGGPEG